MTSHKDFWINSRKGDSLAVNLTTWKLFADQFYRSSEVLYKQITIDYSRMISDHTIQRKTGNFDHRKYTPSIDNNYLLLIGYCLENLIKGILVFENPNLV